MQAVLIIVYVLALRRMILDDAILFVPEQGLEEAHDPTLAADFDVG
jgi:hypothetical protein